MAGWAEKALLSLILLGYRDKAPADFVSIGLAHMTRLLGVQLDLAALSRQINLVFVGALIVIRMRSVLGGLGAVSCFKVEGEI